MPRFTFATGNARKVLALPLYGLGGLASRVVPRKPRLWVFGSGAGVGEGGLALLLHARSVDPKLRLVWLARNDADLRDAAALGIKAVRRSTWRGFRLTLRAGVIVVTHGFGDANRFGTKGGLIVQLWHGIPFKRIHLDSPATVRVPVLSRFGVARQLVRQAYVRSARGIGIFAVSSPLAAARIASAFALPADRVVVTGDPRDDVLAIGTAADRRARARGRISELTGRHLPDDSRLLLYAPTWRDGEIDPAIPSETDWRRIGDYLEATDSRLVIRSHALGAGDYSAGATASDRVLMLGADLQADVTPLLPAFDALITDYSSIAFDYALVGGMLLYLAPDVAEYTASHGLYERYGDFSGGTEVTSWAAMIALLQACDRDAALAQRLRAHAEWVAERVHSFRDGHNTARVYEQIVARLSGAGGAATRRGKRHGLAVDSLVIAEEGRALAVGGPLGSVRPASVRLDGSRLQLPGEITLTSRRWSARVPLVTARWGGPALPPPSGRYNLRATTEDGRRVDLEATATPPRPALYAGLHRLRVMIGATGIDLDVSSPLKDDELGKSNQSRLEAEYRRSRKGPADAVYFESYFGQNASCNPRAIDRALAAARPNTVRYWSVTDASVEVPPGAIAVLEGSAEWWQARASVRLLVVNDWLRKRYRKKPGRTVLQTWHGTPLKRIALDRGGVRPRTAVATYREKSRWDIMLAQNEFSSEIFRSAYAIRGPIWQEGYPRDDVLATGDPTVIRDRLGIAPGTKVVLYAPTWRDDRPDKVDHLDVASFAHKLGKNHVTLVRGHSRTMRPGTDLFGPGVIDVTVYPDISELFLVADALVTDYSSVMFDFTVTGKPIYFFTPDLDHYRDELRGFYFDLLPVAPGPVLADPAELVRMLRNPGSEAAEYADRYAAWQQRFNPRDDGHAAERVVQRLIAEGVLD
jgi:CDP-glycerol glycerophosphotransferase